MTHCAGPINVAEEVLQFVETFTNDAILHAGGLPWGIGHDALVPGFRRSVSNAALVGVQSLAHNAELVSGLHTGKDMVAKSEVDKAMRRGRRE